MLVKTLEITFPRVFISKLPGGEYRLNPKFLTAVVSPGGPWKKNREKLSFRYNEVSLFITYSNAII